jgi:gas vesicle protein
VSGKEVSSFFTGFFMGALVGGAAALILAPQSGEETRAQIRDKGIELKEKAETTYGEVLQKVEATTEDLRKKTDEISAKIDEAIAQGKEEIAKVTTKAKKAEETVEEAAEEVVEETSEEAEA